MQYKPPCRLCNKTAHCSWTGTFCLKEKIYTILYNIIKKIGELL